MTGLTRLERARLARERAQQMEARARKLEAAERDAARRRDVARKAILGGALLAAIRSGLLPREDWDRLVWPRISLTDRQRLAGWPWEPGSQEPSAQPQS